MRFVRQSAVLVTAVLLLVLGTATVAGARPSTSTKGAGSPTTYNVWVGAENARRGVDIMAYFPDTLRIHVGDTVRWYQNSNEIHTVTFLGGQALPEFVGPAALFKLSGTPSPLAFNPLATNRTQGTVKLGDQATWANSGIMGREQGQYRWFKVTFTAEGTYPYVCLVHGRMMSGTVQVVGSTTHVPTPMKDKAIARHQIARQMAKVPAVFKAARRATEPPIQNADGTMTHRVLLGYDQGQIGLMRFFPSKVSVRAGDTVTWMMGSHSMAPHTVTFLNGMTEPELVMPVPQQNGTVALYVNPEVLSPLQPATTLLRTGLYNSGLLQPGTGQTSSLTIGDMTPGPLRYLCLLHDTSGMRGTLVVLP